MKRIVCMVAAVCVLISLSACTSKRNVEKPANFYYLSPTVSYHRPDGMIKPEEREIADTGDDIAKILSRYLRGPESPEFKSPFPQNVSVIKVTQSNGILSIVLSDHFASLTGYDLSVACACITMTLQELVDTQLVQISAETALLDGAQRITMNKDSLVIFDEPQPTETNDETTEETTVE